MICGIILHKHYRPLEWNSLPFEPTLKMLFQNRCAGFSSNLYFLGDSPRTDHYDVNNSSPNNYASFTLWTPSAAWTCTPVSHPTFTPTIWSVQGATSLVSGNHLRKIGCNVFLCSFKTISSMNLQSMRLFNRLGSSSDSFQITTICTVWHRIFAHTSDKFFTSETAQTIPILSVPLY